MSLKRILIALTLVGILALALSAGAQSADAATYRLQGAYTTIQTCEGGICDRFYDYDGTASCVSRCQNASPTGTFTLELSGQGRFPPSPCVSKRVSGTLSFLPGDPIFPAVVAQVSGHNVDFKGYKVRGQITVGALTGRSVSAFVSYPVDPISPALDGCTPGTFSGTFQYPGDPI
jgi:hypothetical protein